MAYVPHHWKDGELLRAEDLNHLEQGVLNEQIGPIGPEGKQGATGPAGRDGADGRNGVDGKDGQTPHIGANGNWWIGDTDTGISASGPTGEKGDKGDPGGGVPAGGTMGQVLAKKTAADYETEWIDSVASFKGRIGNVVPESGDYTAEMVGAIPTGNVAKIQLLTSEQYEELTSKDAKTLYLIQE